MANYATLVKRAEVLQAAAASLRSSGVDGGLLRWLEFELEVTKAQIRDIDQSLAMLAQSCQEDSFGDA